MLLDDDIRIMRLFELFDNLFETPLPQGFEPDYFDPEKHEKGSKQASTKYYKKYSSKSIIDKLLQHGIKLGKGSSRVAFLLNVEASQFYQDILRKYDLPTSGMIPTVIKLALNSRGIAQNRSEIDHHDNYGHWDDGKYLLPILDTSARIKNIEFDDISLSHYIQMPLAKPPSKAQFKKWFIEEFGNVYDIFMNGWYRNVHELMNNINKEFQHFEDNRTEEQIENWDSFMNLVQYTGLQLGDLTKSANWGFFNGRCYIIDYGFDESTKPLYGIRNKIVATGFVDPNGNIHLVEK